MQTQVQTYSGGGLVPAYPKPEPARFAVRLPASVSYPKGQVLGEASGANEVQTLTLTTGGTLGGTYTLAFGGNVTGAIAFNATAATVTTALEALASIGAGNVLVTGTTPTTSGGTLTITFQNALGRRDVAALVPDATSLTGTTPGAAITTATAGAGVANETQVISKSGTVSGGTFTVSYGGETTAALAYNVAPADLQTALEGFAGIDPGDVAVTGTAGSLYVLRFAQRFAGTDISAVTIDNTAITGGGTYAVATPVAGAAGTPGTFKAYSATATDGSQIPKAILEYPASTDASGNLTWGDVAGQTEWGGLNARLYAPAFFDGSFRTGDLTGLTEAGLAAAGWRLASGTVANGVVSLS